MKKIKGIKRKPKDEKEDVHNDEEEASEGLDYENLAMKATSGPKKKEKKEAKVGAVAKRKMPQDAKTAFKLSIRAKLKK